MNKIILALSSILLLGAANYPDPTVPFRGQPNPVYAEMTSKYAYSFDSTWGDIKKPYPTNAWFTNLPNIPIVPCAKVDWEGNVPLCGNIQPKPTDECFGQAWCPQRFIPNLTGTINVNNGPTFAPAVPLPYILGKSPTGGLKVAFSSTPTGVSTETPQSRKPNAVFAVLWDPAEDIEMGATEFGNLTTMQPTYKIKSFTPLSTTLIMKGPQGFGNESLEAPIVRGSPYITVKYNDLTPRLTFEGVTVKSINGVNAPATLPAGTRFEITENTFSGINGKPWNQVWVVYFSSTVTPTWKMTKDKLGANQDIFVLDEPYKGTVRLALLSDGQDVNNNPTILDQYSGTIPIGGQVNYSIANNTITETFTWNTENGQTPLIMAMLHQQQTFNVATKTQLQTGIKMGGNAGTLEGVTASTWTMQEPTIPTIQLTEINQTQFNNLDSTKKTAIINSISNDVNNPGGFTGSYTGGKHFARLARLALIANLASDTTSRDAALKTIRDNMKLWMQGQTANGDNLFYDSTLGGIVPSHDDFQAMTKYDDHHFHYGYFVYTLAVMANLDKTWANTPIDGITPIDWAKFLIRDYANPNSDDPFFPYSRYQDAYDGHSWASGLEVTGDGKNQESVSEAVNAYYAIALLGDEISDGNLSNWGRFLLAKEIRAAKTYWQITSANDIYDPSFPYLTSTNIWNNKIDFHTFFETTNYVGYTSYGIELLPFTAITPQLLRPWVQDSGVQSELIAVKDYNNATPKPWQYILLKGIALGDPHPQGDTWWNLAVAPSTVADYDDGDSRTNTLFSIAAYQTLF